MVNATKEVKPVDVVPKAQSEVTKKKKRPWRDKVRKEARKQRLRKEREAASALQPQPKPVGDAPKKKKKKRGPKKKKWVEKADETKTGDESETTAKTAKGTNKVILNTEEALKKLESGRFRYLNEQLYTIKGSDAWEFFKNDPASFECYHKGFAEQVKKWPNHPLETIINWLRNLSAGQKVIDLGCGEAKIAEAMGDRHTIHSFDLVAVNERVTACDMAHLPLETDTIDAAIFCLSLMGTNLVDFVKEARRVLKTGGLLKIAEVTSRFVNVKKFSRAICQMGFEQMEKRDLTDYFTILQFKKTETVENKRPLGLKLNPCLYKKR